MKHIKTLVFWKDIPGYEGLYQISNLGEVKRLAGSPRCKEDRILKKLLDKNGYFYVDLFKNGKGKKIKIHRLVAMTFLPNKEELPEVDHINGDKTDNRVCNLQWITGIENNRKRENGICVPKKVKCIETGEVFESIASAARSVDRNPNALSYALKNNTKSAGYHWIYYRGENE